MKTLTEVSYEDMKNKWEEKNNLLDSDYEAYKEIVEHEAWLASQDD